MHSLHIVIADDDASKRLLIRYAVMDTIPTATLFETPWCDEVLEIVRTWRVDALITDQDMPRMTGVELIESVKVKAPHIPILMVTDNEKIVEQALAAGASAVVCNGNWPGVKDWLKTTLWAAPIIPEVKPSFDNATIARALPSL